MPKLLMFAPCDRVIINKRDNTTSLISIIEAFSIDIPEGTKLRDEEMKIPIKWSVLSLWERQHGEEGKQFEQRTQLVLPNGKQALDGSTMLDFVSTSNRFRAVNEVVGFPVSPAGACVLKLSIREVGQEAWQDVADYSIFITRPESSPEGSFSE
ncbi:MAG TPA: hypothetical protein VEY09_01775 [Pyrinomonadaceae bacterium]|nr:hypothetical protein [Pyrinomonadaceae bacterium]